MTQRRLRPLHFQDVAERRGDPDIVQKIANLLGHKKLAQTYHDLEGLLKLDGPNDAATALTWGGDVDDAFVVAAAAQAAATVASETTSTAAPSSEEIEPDAAPMATVYPIPIGRPRKVTAATARSEGQIDLFGTYLGRVIRDFERKLSERTPKVTHLLGIVTKILSQKTTSKNKIYSVHAPEVVCIAKGKARVKYEFGSKVSVASAVKGAWVVGVNSFASAPFDGHTIPDVLTQIKSITGAYPKAAYCDRGYQGSAGYIFSTHVYVQGKSSAQRGQDRDIPSRRDDIQRVRANEAGQRCSRRRTRHTGSLGSLRAFQCGPPTSIGAGGCNPPAPSHLSPPYARPLPGGQRSNDGDDVRRRIVNS